MKLFKNFTMKMVKNEFYFMKAPLNIILIENTKLSFFVGCVYIYNLSNKKVYI